MRFVTVGIVTGLGLLAGSLPALAQSYHAHRVAPLLRRHGDDRVRRARVPAVAAARPRHHQPRQRHAAQPQRRRSPGAALLPRRLSSLRQHAAGAREVSAQIEALTFPLAPTRLNDFRLRHPSCDHARRGVRGCAVISARPRLREASHAPLRPAPAAAGNPVAGRPAGDDVLPDPRGAGRSGRRAGR